MAIVEHPGAEALDDLDAQLIEYAEMKARGQISDFAFRTIDSAGEPVSFNSMSQLQDMLSSGSRDFAS